MKIKSYIPASTIDWPGYLSAVLFLPGCNWSCEFCHNTHIDDLDDLSINDILYEMDHNKIMVDRVIITGGEPTIYGNELIEFVKMLKGKGFKVGLHTNGSNPDVIESVIDDLEFIGMDIKGDIYTYSKIPGAVFEDVIESMIIILSRKDSILYEFRTTAYPGYVNTETISNVLNMIIDMGGSFLTIQQYRDPGIGVERYNILDVIDNDNYPEGVTINTRGFDMFVYNK